MSEHESTRREWQGTWIPRSIWKHSEISWMEKCLWAEISNLDDSRKGGCWASNEYLAEVMGSSAGSIAVLISKLRKLGLVADVSFNGRNRVIKAIAPEDSVNAAIIKCSSQPLTNDKGSYYPLLNKDTRLDTSLDITPIPPEGATTATTENHSQQDSPDDQSTDDIPIWDKPQKAQEKPADPPTPPKTPKPDSITPQMINRFVEIWNEHAASNGWRTSRALSESRKRAIRARLKDKIFNENFIAALNHMAKDRFFSGSNDRQWVANIDYFLQPKSFDKLMDRMGGDGNVGKKAGPPKWKDALLFICREHPDEVERHRGIENCESFDDLPPDIAIKVKSVITYGSIYGGGNL